MSFVLDHIGLVVGGVRMIDDVCLSLEPGSLNVLLGPTLAGKTTIMRLMAGLDRPTSGRVLVDGKDVTGVHVRDRSVAMVYQQFINYPTLSVYENIASPLRVKGAPRAEIDRRVKETADLLRLGPMLERTPLQLSGGQQQRCAIARAIVKGANLVLLDEPLANLDYKLREEMREELPRIFAESGAIFIYATTEPTEALLLGGAVATLSQGRVVQFGPTPQVYRRPVNLRSAETFSDPPLNQMLVEKRGTELILPSGAPIAVEGPFAPLPDGRYTLAARAHEIALARQNEAAVELVGTVDVTEITGSESFVHVHLGALRWVVLTPGVHEIGPGAPVRVYVDLNRVFVFDADGRFVGGPGEN